MKCGNGSIHMELIILTMVFLIEQLMESFIGLREAQLWYQLDGSNFQVTVPRYNNISRVFCMHTIPSCIMLHLPLSEFLDQRVKGE